MDLALALAVADGNPGAASVVAQLLRRIERPPRMMCQKTLLGGLLELPLTGPKLWEAYKDIYEEDIEKLYDYICDKMEEMIINNFFGCLKDPTYDFERVVNSFLLDLKDGKND